MRCGKHISCGQRTVCGRPLGCGHTRGCGQIAGCGHTVDCSGHTMWCGRRMGRVYNEGCGHPKEAAATPCGAANALAAATPRAAAAPKLRPPHVRCDTMGSDLRRQPPVRPGRGCKEVWKLASTWPAQRLGPAGRGVVPGGTCLRFRLRARARKTDAFDRRKRGTAPPASGYARAAAGTSETSARPPRPRFAHTHIHCACDASQDAFGQSASCHTTWHYTPSDGLQFASFHGVGFLRRISNSGHLRGEE